MNYSDKLFFLEKILGSYKFSNNTKEAEFYCPFCLHRKKKLSINIETLYWHCWVCAKAGRGLSYLLKMSGASDIDLKRYEKYFDIKKDDDKNKKELKEFKCSLPKEFDPLCLDTGSIIGKKFLEYLDDRNITKEDTLRHKIGFSISGKYTNRVIFPSFDKDGLLNFYTARDVSSHPRIKYLEPDVPRGYKNEIVINDLNINWKDPIILVEGFIDMIKAGTYNVIPLFGSVLNKKSIVFQKIIRNNSKVFLALDPDAIKKTLYMAKSLLQYEIEVYNVNIDPHKDVGEMNKKEFQDSLASAYQLNSETILVEKLKLLRG